MLGDLVWKICSLTVRLFRLFDRKIIASDLWKVKIHEITNCPILATDRFHLLVHVSVDVPTKKNCNDTNVTFSSSDDHEPRVTYKAASPRCTVKVYLPFKTRSLYINLQVLGNKDSIVKRFKNLELNDVGPGIHKYEIFVEDLIEVCVKGERRP